MEKKRPQGVIAIGIFYIIAFGSSLTTGSYMGKRYIAISIALSLYFLACSAGLFMMKNWGRILAIIPAVGLIFFGIKLLSTGTIMSASIMILLYVVIIVYLLSPKVRKQFKPGSKT